MKKEYIREAVANGIGIIDTNNNYRTDGRITPIDFSALTRAHSRIIIFEMEGFRMNNYDVAGILTTYAHHARYAKNTEQLRDVVRRLKEELDLRKIRIEKEEKD